MAFVNPVADIIVGAVDSHHLLGLYQPVLQQKACRKHHDPEGEGHVARAPREVSGPRHHLCVQKQGGKDSHRHRENDTSVPTPEA